MFSHKDRPIDKQIRCESIAFCEVEKIAEEKGLPVLGEIPYDPLMIEAQREEKNIVEYWRDSVCSKALERVYERFSMILEELR